MTRLARLVAAFLILALASGLALGAAMPEAVRRAWGFDRTDLPPHPGVRFGVLPNGMRYAIMRNGAPANALAVRLHFDAGAAVEGERERGFMHLLEHMIFHGSENIPEGALPLLLAHRGLRHWSDMNAFTSYDETVYRIDMAKADRGARDAALLVMREIAGRLVFTRKAVEGAKRKVVEEIELRNLPQDLLTSTQNSFLLPGTPLARGPVAGSKRSVRRATPEALRSLYERFYRPERATLVVVGDADPALAEAEIAHLFSDWRGAHATVQPLPRIAIPAERGNEARTFVHKSAPTSVMIASVQPVGGAADHGRQRDAHFLERLGSEMLTRRLTRAGQSGSSAVYTYYSAARLASLELTPADRDWQASLKRGACELRRALREGFARAELEEQLGAMRATLGKDAAPRTSAALADAIVDAVGRKLVFTAPGDAAASEAYLSGIRLDDVNAAFRRAWSAPGRLIFVSHNQAVRGGEAAILNMWADAVSESGKEGESGCA